MAIERILEQAAVDGKGLWFAAQFCKGADHEVKQESSLDHLAKYPLVNRLLQTMGLRISDLQKPFAIFTIIYNHDSIDALP